MSRSAGFDVVVFGSLHMDIMVRAPDRPRRGETVAGQSWAYKPGGKGGNQAVEAARAGVRTAMAGAVGDDDFGRGLVDNLRRKGVDAEAVVRKTGAGSGMSVAIVDAGGDYGAVIVSGVNLLLGSQEAEAAAALVAETGILVLQNEISEEPNRAALAAARRRGIRTLLNAAPARPPPEDFGALLDLLVVNAIEAEALGAPPVASLAEAEAAARRLLPLAETVVVTAGGAGVAAARREGPSSALPAHRVEVVGTHGAGDAFIGALAAALSGGGDLDEALRRANAAAARHVSAHGASPGSAADAWGPITVRGGRRDAISRRRGSRIRVPR
ncbi:MAG TPA: PfkB family carbohydrate kinase [Lichenihabitans sp.]|nr:PfkB family carbohydrate kinase [Lichenihabitans sp.]